MEKINVIVPTRNRKTCLLDLIKNLNLQNHEISKLIIIDSSDKPIKISELKSIWPIKLIHTEIKSAAIQRNFGLDLVESNCRYVAFLDDDVLVPADYLNRLINTLKENDGIGVSGITSDLLMKRQQLKYNILIHAKRFFLLDAKKPGSMTYSGINVPPYPEKNKKPFETEWLIGCSLWDYNNIKKLKFESTFFGQSVGEDVLFSLKASKKGRLFVDPSIVIEHLLININRPSTFEFWYMWSKNRKLIIKELGGSIRNKVAYCWSNFGQILIFIVNSNYSLNSILASIKGVIRGMLDE